MDDDKPLSKPEGLESTQPAIDPAINTPINTAETNPKNTTEKIKTLATYAPLLSATAATLAAIAAFGSCRSAYYSYQITSGKQRVNEDHDLIARILNFSVVPLLLTKNGTNGEIYADVAFINLGNQREIVRSISFLYAEAGVTNGQYIRSDLVESFQIDRGERKFVRAVDSFAPVNTGRPLRLDIGVVAMDRNGVDVEILLPVGQIDLQSDGKGGQWTGNWRESQPTKVISNAPLPNQRKPTRRP